MVFVVLRMRHKKKGQLYGRTMPAMRGVWDLKRPSRGKDGSRAPIARNVRRGEEDGLQESPDREGRPAELGDTEAGVGLEVMAERGPVHEMPEVTTPRGG